MPKAVSCGFIVFAKETGAVLACHPTGRPDAMEMSYDIPKGHLEAGESALDAALRELKEETGIALPEDAPVHEIGLVPYQKQKSLHLFSTVLQNVGHVGGQIIGTGQGKGLEKILFQFRCQIQSRMRGKKRRRCRGQRIAFKAKKRCAAQHTFGYGSVYAAGKEHTFQLCSA